MRYGILGGGFGLYGYLPAIAGLEPSRIVTLEKYRAIIRRRPELADFERRIVFVSESEALFDQCDMLVVSQRPADQERLVDAALAIGWNGTLVLEKPLARTPATAELMLEKLTAAKMRLIVGFILSETGWAKELSVVFRLHQPTSIQFDWRFLAHHYGHGLVNWKRQVSEGGGALRFYAIHLLALLAQLGDWSPIHCSPQSVPDEDPSFTCSVQTATCHAEIHCDSQWHGRPAFNATLKTERGILFHHCSSNPFAKDDGDFSNQPGSPDFRIVYIQKLLQRAKEGPLPRPAEFRGHLRLWSALESQRSGNG